jgi:hypothetical protein
MCNMNCNNCHYKAMNPPEDDGHCYMFQEEPEGDCRQFALSSQAKNPLAIDIDNIR